MPLFETTQQQKEHISEIVMAMSNAGFSDSFIDGWQKLATLDKGIYELGELWNETTCHEERNMLIDFIKKEISQ